MYRGSNVYGSATALMHLSCRPRALLSGHAQVMSVSETPLVQAILQGHSIYIVSTVTGHQETKFVGRRDRGIALASDLKGKNRSHPSRKQTRTTSCNASSKRTAYLLRTFI